MSIIRFNDDRPSSLQKFMAFGRFKYILENRVLYVSRIDSFGDKQEGVLPRSMFQDDNAFQKFYQSQAKYLYVSCFTKENENLDFMFKEYTGVGDNEDYSNSLFFVINREDFEKVLNTPYRVYSGLVNYHDDFSDSIHVSGMTSLDVCFSKQKQGFEKDGEKYVPYHKEKEYRYIFDQVLVPMGDINNQVVTLDEIWAESAEVIKEDKSIEVNLDDLSFIEKVCLHPRFSEDNEQELRDLIDKLGLNMPIERLNL